MWSTLIRSEPEVEDGWDEDGNDFQEDDGLDFGSVDEHQEDEQGNAAHESSSPVGGVFMGRLTRFLEQVTHPENEEGDDDDDDEEFESAVGDEDGWGDSDDIDLMDEPGVEEPMDDGFVEERIDDVAEEPQQPPQQQTRGGWAASMVQGIRSAAASAMENVDDPGDLVDEDQDGDANFDHGDQDFNEGINDGWDDNEDQGDDPNFDAGEDLNEGTDDGWDDDDAFDMSDTPGDSPQLSNQLNSIATFGAAVEQPLNNLLEEIREMDETQPEQNGHANDKTDDYNAGFTTDELAAVALMPLAEISEVDNHQHDNDHEGSLPMESQPTQDREILSELQPTEQREETQEENEGLPRTDSLQRPLDKVLNEIEVQERQSLVMRAQSQEEDPNDSDLAEVLEQKHDEAVLAIQEEMQAMGDTEETPETPESGTEKKSANIVDHTPVFPANVGADPSLDPQLESEDRTRDASPRAVDGIAVSTGDEDVYEDENEDDFGPVVDHTPKESTTAPSTAVSLVVQATDLIQDMDADDAMDETVDDGWVGDELDDLDEEDEIDNTETQKEPAVVDHTPLEDDNRTSISKVADTSVVVLRSEGGTLGEDMIEDGEDEGDQIEFGPVVDHLPVSEKPPPSASQSLAVNAPALEQEFREDDAMDETVVAGGEESVAGLEPNAADAEKTDLSTDGEVKDGWDEEEEEETPNERHATLPPLEPYAVTASDDHVVDHTPSELNFNPQTRPNDPSVAVLATGEDLTRDTGMGSNEDVYDDENEMAYVPVVDHTPGPTETIPSSYNSVAAHAPSVDVGDEGMDASLLGDSTIAGGTLDGGTLDGAGWDHEDPILEEESLSETQPATTAPAPAPGENMVDHLPSEMGAVPAVKAADPSVAVLASIDENDNDSAAGTQVYGPVVDHTPTTPAPQAPTRSDSVIAQMNDADTDVDETLVGGSTIGAGSIAEGDEEDTIDDELPSALRSEANLVDRVPARPEPRPGDASTIVAADASEMLSAVDDMEEAGDFGPVVDQTPPAVPAMQQRTVSGAGSTVVFAPQSVATDDFDPDETDAHVEDDWDQDHTAMGEAAPNPQSGNDEPVVNEQLVDFLPPQNPPPALDEEGEPSTEASSEFAVGGAQSLLQPEDPKEDDFGPVVDVTPAPRNSVAHSVVSAASTASLVTSTEIGRMLKDDKAEAPSVDESANESAGSKPVVDHVPNNIRELRNADSLATVGQSQFTDEEDEEEETDSKFGPVVDHLPTPRASTVASRGGSTIDALGTVSEGDSVEEADGWADDLDMDTSVGAASALTDRVSQAQSATKGLFRRSSAGDSDRNMSVKWDSTVRDSNTSDVAASPTQNDSVYVDARDASTVSQETKYFDPNSSEGGWLDKDQSPKLPGASFAEAETPPSTPHNRPKGVRRPQQYGSPWLDISGLDSNCAANTSADISDAECQCLKRLLKVTKEAGTMYGTLIAADGKTVQVDFGQILHDEMVKRRLVEEEARALREIVENQKRERSEAAEPLERELKTLRKSNDELSGTVSRLRKESDEQREENSRISDELNNMTRLVDETKEQRQELETKIGELQAENMRIAEDVSQSRARVEELEKAQVDVAAEHKRVSDESAKEIDDLKLDVSGKNQQVEQLKSQLQELESNLDKITGSNNKLNDDLAASRRERNSLKDEVLMLHGELEISQQAGDQASADAELISMLKAEKMASAETCRSLATEVDELKRNLRTEQDASSAELEESRNQVASLEQKLSEKDTEYNDAVSQVSTLEAKVDALQSERDSIDDEAIKLSLEIQEEREERRKSDSKALELEAKISDLKKSAEAAEEDHKLVVKGLEGKISDGVEARTKIDDEIVTLKRSLEQAEVDAVSKTQESDALMNSLSADLTNKNMECTKLTAEISSLRDQMQTMQDSMSELSKEKADLIDTRARELSTSKTECQNLRSQLDTVQANLDAAVSEHAKREAELSTAITQLESAAAQRDSDFGSLTEKTSGTEQKLREALSLHQQLQTQLAIAEGKLQMSEQKLAKSLEDSKIKVEALTLEKTTLEEQLSEKESQLKTYAESQSKSQQELGSVESQRQQLQTRLAITEGKLQMAENKLSEGADDSAKHLKASEQLQTQLTIAEGKLQMSEQKLAKSLEESKIKVEALTLEKTTLEEQLSEKESQLKTHAESQSKSQQELGSVESQRQQLQTRLAITEGKLQMAENKLSEGADDSAKHLKASEQLQTQLTIAEGKLQMSEQKLAKSLEESKIKVEALTLEKTTLEEQLSEKESQLKTHAESQSKSQQELGSVESQRQQLQTRLAITEGKLQMAENKLSEGADDSAKHLKASEQLQTQLTIAEGKLQMSEQKLAKSLEESKIKVEALTLEKTTLEEQLSEKESQLKTHAESQSKSQQELGSLESQRQQLQTRLAITEGKLQMAEKKLSEGANDSTQHLKTLEQEKSSANAELKAKEAELKELRESLEQQIESASLTHDELRNELAMSQAEVDSLTQSMSSKDEAHKSAIAAMKVAVEDKDKALTDMAYTVEQTKHEKAMLEAGLSEKDNSLLEEKDRLGAAVFSLEQERDGLREQLYTLEAARSEQSNMERSRLDENEGLKTLLIRAEEQTSQLKHEVDAAHRHIQAMEVEASNRSKALEELASGKAAADSSLSQLRLQLNAHSQQEAQSSAFVAKLQEECRQLKRQLENATVSTNNFSEAERVFQTSLAESEKMLAQTSKERDALAEENEELLVQLGLLKEDMDFSEDRAAQVETDLQNLESIAEQFLSVSNGTPSGGGSPIGAVQKTSIALQTLQAKIIELEASLKIAESEKHRLGAKENNNTENSNFVIASLERRCEEFGQEVTKKQAELDRLSSVEYDCELTKSKLEDLQSSFDRLHTESVQQIKTIEDKDAQIAGAEARLAEMLKDDRIVENLNQRLRELESEARAAQRRAEQSEEEYEKYRAQVSQQNDQATSNTQAMKQEVHDLRTQLEAATIGLQATQTQLVQKEEQMQQEIHALADELRNSKLPMPEPSAHLSGNVDELKAQIVSLAMALERSESRRAEAMDSLQLERQGNADSLRRLGESVKRFYTSVYPSDNGESS